MLVGHLTRIVSLSRRGGRVAVVSTSVQNLCQTLQNIHSAAELAPLHGFKFVSGASALHQCQSLGIETVTDVPSDRASHFLSACQQLEKVAGEINGPPSDCVSG